MNDLFLDEIVRADEPAPGTSMRSARRAERAERDRRRKQRRRRNLIALIVSLAILAGGAFAVVKLVLPMLDAFGGTQTESSDFPGPGNGSVEVVIPPGATGSDMAQVLVDAGVVQTTRAFTRAFAADPSAASIQPGTYQLLLEMRAQDAVSALLNSANRIQTKVTLPEGFRLEQILDKLSSVTTVPVEEFQAAMADTAATGLPPEAEGNYEGWLFASTYTFEPGTTPTEMIRTMVAQTIAVLDQNGVPADQRETVLIKASLVERESPNPEASAQMARAIQNRLDKDMRLEIDASIAYGAGKPGTELTRTGLPPTPIASPSTDSIHAVMNPADGPWLFWCTVNLDTGETRFTDSYEEHKQNVAELRAWEEANGR
jgi:UPF0755 protein